jgi:GT2 family glycosyltransferase
VTAGAPVVVAIVSWNTRELLARCLESLLPEAECGRAEAWVVDNASSDGSAALVRERFPRARLLALNDNLGFGAAVNLVAERTASPWLAIANADTALRPGALAALLAAGGEDPGAGAIAPRLVQPDGSTQHSVFGFPTVPHTALLASGLYRLSPDLADRLAVPGHWDVERARRVPWAVAAFLLVRREAWRQVGGFDPRQFMYAEDLDLGWRAARAGWSTHYVPAARVRHHASAATTQAWGDERTLRWLRSTYAWMLRRRGLARTRITALINVGGAYARARDPAFRRWGGLHRRTGLAPRRELERHR